MPGKNSSEHGVNTVSAYYQVQFDGKQYELYLFDHPINKRIPKKLGLYSMALLPLEEAENNKEFLSKKAGIYTRSRDILERKQNGCL